MTDLGVLTLPLPDAAARERIATDLDTNLLVEAGAGSGKTTELVSRMLALITAGIADVDQIAAVTFTRKAAGELRQRFQMQLEQRIAEQREDETDPLVAARLHRALSEIDRAFVGTIHSFCARLLRERPLEVGLDPGFEELRVEERIELRRRFWESYLERLTRDSDPILEELARAGLRPARLDRLFDHVVENPDVDFPVEAAPAPSVSELGPIRAELDAIVDHGWELMPSREPRRGWDSLQRKIRTLHFTRDVTGWREPADLFEGLAALCKRGQRGHTITQKRWKDGSLAKALRDRANAFGVGDTPAHRQVDRWYAHRYALAVRLARHAAEEYAAHRVRIGKLDFQDLLILAARLLRSNPEVRRQLGGRYRHLLVDEFQDTDPLQAEIILLLASEPEDSPRQERESSEPADWRAAVPRPGALFVVGDPKQSIYRFRRADIQLYGIVKERFAAFGAVVELTTNFRSRPPIGDLVNQLFCGPDFFPEEATAEQAAFEPLNTRPSEPLGVGEGVFVYEIAPEASNRAAAAEDDAARLAPWIQARIAAGERQAGDFLVLTRRRGPLASYARALEAHGVPVQVTGAGVGAEEEIHELEVVIECMIDPTNPVKVVSALVGLFFGIDYDRLVTHRLEGGAFNVMCPGKRGHEDVVAALGTLNEWWQAATSEPADIFITGLVAELGLLPYAAAGELGTLRAGAVSYAMDAVRAAALAGEASLPGALGALRAALNLPEAEAPLEPGRTDAVRLMNLHQAKGLEAPVVVLADPSGSRDRRPDIHIRRRSDGTAVGYLRVSESMSGFLGDQLLAAPEGWNEKEARELRFEAAEEVRLTYVAVTRAMEELVVARWPDGRGQSPWASLDPWLSERARLLTLERAEPAPGSEVELSAADAAAAVAGAAERLGEMAVARFRHTSVTELAKVHDAAFTRDNGEPVPAAGTEFRGLSWGSVVHGALAAAAHSTDQALRSTCRNLLVEEGRPLDDHGEPTELGELLELVRRVSESGLWARARAADRHLVEIPFAVPQVAPPVEIAEPGPADVAPLTGPGQLELFSDEPIAVDAVGVAADTDSDEEEAFIVLEGVIDLVFREADGWVVADYKTDLGTDPDFEARAAAYRRQVELYADAWATLTGEPVKERVLFYTAQERVESW